MTWRSRILSCFPAIFVVGCFVLAGMLLLSPGWISASLLFCHLYCLPLACCRLHGLFWPIEEGTQRLDLPDTYVPWWGGHMFQLPYDAFPQLEGLLRLIPGLYSLWLKGWGASIGRNVHWTPRVEITDRGMLDIGDNAVIGHRVGMYAHVVSRRSNGELRVHLCRIRIGANALVGAFSRLGPGAEVPAGGQLATRSDLWAGASAQPQDSA